MTIFDKLNSSFGLDDEQIIIPEPEEGEEICGEVVDSEEEGTTEPTYLPTPIRPSEPIPFDPDCNSHSNLDFHKADIQDDYRKSKDLLAEIISSGQEVLNDVVNVAKETNTARHYEVAATLIKTLSDCSKDMIELHKKIAELDEKDKKSRIYNIPSSNSSGGTTTQIIDKAIIYTTNDLIEALKQVDD